MVTEKHILSLFTNNQHFLLIHNFELVEKYLFQMIKRNVFIGNLMIKFIELQSKLQVKIKGEAVFEETKNESIFVIYF